MRDESIRSCKIASQTIMLAVKSIGCDSCPIIGFDPKKVGVLINLPEDRIICMIITIGKAVKEAHARDLSIQFDTIPYSYKSIISDPRYDQPRSLVTRNGRKSLWSLEYHYLDFFI